MFVQDPPRVLAGILRILVGIKQFLSILNDFHEFSNDFCLFRPKIFQVRKPSCFPFFPGPPWNFRLVEPPPSPFVPCSRMMNMPLQCATRVFPQVPPINEVQSKIAENQATIKTMASAWMAVETRGGGARSSSQKWTDHFLCIIQHFYCFATAVSHMSAKKDERMLKTAHKHTHTHTKR